MRILVVEDEKHIRQGIVQMLGSENFEVCEAESVASALAFAHDETCDVVLCDHHLPDGESFDVLSGLPEKTPFSERIGQGCGPDFFRAPAHRHRRQRRLPDNYDRDSRVGRWRGAVA